MALVTFCPRCNTAFRVNATQLQTHNGDVRCGACQLVFNGFSKLITVNESAIVSSNSASTIKNKIAAEASVITSTLPNLPVLPAQPTTLPEQSHLVQQNTLPSLQPTFQPRLEAESQASTSLKTQLSVDQPLQSHSATNIENTQLQSESPIAIELTSQNETQHPTQSGHLENQHTFTETFPDTFSDNMSDEDEKPNSYGWQVFFGFANTILLLLFVMQMAYHYRTELTVLAPDSKPMLDRYCQLLGCSVPYPQKIEQLGIETSDLQKTEARQPVISTLSATIRNHAPYPQALPQLQLSLLDAKDQLTANRILTPQEYLSDEQQTKKFIDAHDDLEIHLNFDSHQLDAFGYRLSLLYL